MLLSLRDPIPARTRHLATGLIVALLAGYTLPPAASACSVAWQEPDPQAIDPSSLRAVRVDGEDLLVGVEWSNNAPAQLQVVLETGSEPPTSLASWSLPTSPGIAEELRLDGAMSAVAEHGSTYRLALIDTAGVAASAVDFALAVECPDNVCRYRVLDGVGGADLPRLPMALWAVFEQAKSLGVLDLAAYVEANHPDLAHHLPGFLWQLQQASGGASTDPLASMAKTAGTDDPVAGCSCQWIEVADYDPYLEDGGQFGSATGSPPTHIAGGVASGAGHFLLAQSYRSVEKTAAELYGTTQFGLVPFCFRGKGAQTTVLATEWPTMPNVTLDLGAIEPCAAPCTPQVDYRADAEVCALGFAQAAAGKRTRAEAWAAGSVFLDGQLLVLVDSDAAANPPPHLTIEDKDIDGQQVSGWRSTTHAVATITGTGFLDLEADNPNAAYDAYVLGGSTFGFDVELSVPFGCPGLDPVFPGVRIQARKINGPGQGGAVLRSWETNP